MVSMEFLVICMSFLRGWFWGAGGAIDLTKVVGRERGPPFGSGDSEAYTPRKHGIAPIVLIAYEVIRFAEPRARVRAGAT
jgi:hypothetical protein